MGNLVLIGVAILVLWLVVTGDLGCVVSSYNSCVAGKGGPSSLPSAPAAAAPPVYLGAGGVLG